MAIKNYFSQKNQWYWIAIVYGIIMLFTMLNLYGLHGVDDTWFASFYYYYWTEGYEFDKLFTTGHAQLAAFGKTTAILYSLWAELFGWDRIYLRTLSVLFIIAGSLIWALIAQKLFNSQTAFFATFFLCLHSDGLMSAAMKIRPEAILLFLMAVAVYLALYKQWFWAFLISFIQIEIHPIAIFAGAYVFAALCADSKFNLASLIQNIPTILIALVLGLGYYLILHWETLSTAVNIIVSASTEAGNYFETAFSRHYLITWFWYSKLHRHLPDFFIILFAFILFIWKFKNTPQSERFTKKFILGAVIAIIGIDILLPKDNGSGLYASLNYPVFLLLIISVINSFKIHHKWLIIAMLLYMLPQYAYIYYKNHEFNFNEYNQLVKQHIYKIDPSMLYIGHVAHWFAFVDIPKHNFSVVIPKNLNGQKAIWIKDSIWTSPINWTPINIVCPQKKLYQFEYAHHQVEFIEIDCQNVGNLNTNN